MWAADVNGDVPRDQRTKYTLGTRTWTAHGDACTATADMTVRSAVPGVTRDGLSSRARSLRVRSVGPVITLLVAFAVACRYALRARLGRSAR